MFLGIASSSNSRLLRKPEEEEEKRKKQKKRRRRDSMELMELVENEPNARPFQCDWQTCNKVRTWKTAEGEGCTDAVRRASTESPIFSAIIASTPMSGPTRA